MKQILAGFLGASVAASPLMANAACFTEVEWRAAHVRVLQTDLQVAALECQYATGYPYVSQYNSFVTKMSGSLAFEAKQLIAHFQRVSGGSWGQELDSYVTLLANESSERSMRDAAFCVHSQGFFQAALAIETSQLEQAALGHVTDHNLVGDLCLAGEPANQAKAPARPKPAAHPADPGG